MSELYFRLSDMEGFTSTKLANGAEEGFSIPIRELLQNSLDASVKAGNEKCEIDIYVKKIPKDETPHIKEYEEVLKLAIKTQKEESPYNVKSENAVGSIKAALNNDSLDVLMFVDNGEGMNGKVLEGLLAERSMKTEEASGSYGAGHITSYHLSSLRYVLYATKYRDENEAIKTLWTGSPILAGYRDIDGKQRGSKGRIVKDKPKDEDEFNPKYTFPLDFPSFVEDKMKKLSSTGTMVVILGLNQKWGESAEYAIVNNFFPALVRGNLVVNIYQGGKSNRFMDEDKVLELVERARDKKRRASKTADILSGQEVYHAYKTIQEKPQDIQMDNGDKVKVYIRNGIEGSSSIILIKNNMVITNHNHMLSSDIRGLKENEDYESFMVIIDVDRDSAPRLFELMGIAENVHHNKLEKKNIPSKDDKKELGKIFKKLTEEIKNYLVPINREGFDLPIFTINKASEKTGGYGRLSGQRDFAKPRPISPVRPKKLDPSKRKDQTSHTQPDIKLRDLNFKKSIYYTGKRKTLEIRMRLEPTKSMKKQDEVYLSIALSEDNDNNRVSEFVDFISLSVDDKDKPVLKQASQQVQLGVLDKGKFYEIRAKVRKPVGFEKIRVALLPILKLKRIQGKDRK